MDYIIKKCSSCEDIVRLHGSVVYGQKVAWWGRCFKCGNKYTVEEFNKLEDCSQ